MNGTRMQENVGIIPKHSKEPRLAFLLSAPYSGATLLSILLGQHPRVSCDGEIFPFDRGADVICSCGKKQIECEYYRDIASSMITENGRKYDERFFYYIPKYSNIYHLSRALEGFWINGSLSKLRNFLCRHFSEINKLEKSFIDIHMELIRKSLFLRSAPIYIDGSKSMRRAEIFCEREYANKVIHLVRDGRAFCNSFLKNKGLSRNCIPIAIKVWKKHIKKVDVLKGRLPHVHLLEVRYNDLCSSPETELKRICEFLGIQYEDSILHFDKRDMHILGNRMRFSYSGDIREDNSWKEKLGKEDLSLINRLAEDELRRFQFI